jgi:hypothetical protein
MRFLSELFQFMHENKKLWLIPLMLVLEMIGFFLYVGGGTVIAPFIYTLF